MKTSASVLQEVSRAVSALEPVDSLSVAFSGGVDSTVLLEALRRLRPALDLPNPRALHVDHGLQAVSANWLEHCRTFCVERGLAFQSMSVDGRATRGQSPEEAARRVRYDALREMMVSGDVLCVGHHADDQAETSLLQMLRGAGVLGGGGMRAQRSFRPGRIARPLLNLRRQDIEVCARSWGLHWIEDPTNRRPHHPRNRLRAEALPLLEEIAPGAALTLNRAAALQREAADAVAQLARIDWGRCVGAEPGSLSRRALANLSSARRRALLRLWVRGHAQMPSQRRLQEVERQICTADRDRKPCIKIGLCQIEVHGDEVLLFAGAATRPRSDVALAWIPEQGDLILPHGRLIARQSEAGGVRSDSPITVRLRCGGERCKPVGRARSQSVKRLLQAYRIPTWRRDDLPLLYRGDELIAVSDLWICDGHAAPIGERGWQIQWQPNRLPLRPLNAP